MRKWYRTLVSMALVTLLGGTAEAGIAPLSVVSARQSPPAVAANSMNDLIYDTLATSCTRLIVMPLGNMGNFGRGKVNLDYFLYGDCDTSDAILGKSDVYLFDGSPVILRHQATPDSIFLTYSMYSNFINGPYSFNGVVDNVPPIFGHSDTITSQYQKVTSAQCVTTDSLVAMEQTWWTPRNAGDSCNFILQQMRVFPYKGTAVSGLTIGEAIDWDIPTDTASVNTCGFDASRNLVYQRGWDKTVDPTQCQRNDHRFGGMALVGWYTMAQHHADTCGLNTDIYGGYTASNAAFVYPTGSFVPRELYDNMQNPGFMADGVAEDQHSVLTYTNNYTLGATDTLMFFTALASVKNGTLADLQVTMDRAKRWLLNRGFIGCPPCCTAPTTGDLNGDGTVDVEDLSRFIDCVILMMGPCWTCFQEADVDKSGSIDISDLSGLIDFLFNGLALPSCP